MAATVAEAAPILTVQGSTLGCFGTLLTCTSFTDQSASGWISFDGADLFSATTDSTGGATGIDLGVFSRSHDNYTGTEDFVLQLTFLAPTGIAGGGVDPFTAQIVGQTNGGGTFAWVNFNNALQTVSFANTSGSGSFKFGVLDLGTGVTPGGVLGKNDSLALLGVIQDLQFTPTGIQTNPGGLQNGPFGPTGVGPAADLTAIPEPSSMLLLGTGLGGVAWRRRRRA